MIRTQQQTLQLQPGEIFYIPKGLKYQSQWFGDEEESKIEFYSFGFEIAPTKNSYILQKISCSPQARTLFAELSLKIPFTEKSIGILYQFFAEVSGQMEQAQRPYSNPILEEATRYIFKNPKAKISQVAAHCSISESGLYALFKKYTGQTPGAFRQMMEDAGFTGN